MTLEELTTLEKLNNAFYKCSKASFWKEGTQRYKVNLLQNNLELQEDLRTGNYKVSPPVQFTLNERGKLRYIKAPAMRDRIVQKILCEEILVPQLSRYLIYDNYASLKNRGTAFARKRIDIFLREHVAEYGNEGYVLQIDIKGYFDHIDHEILKHMVRQKIHEPEEVMTLIDYIIDSSSDSDKGLSLGSEAPQILAVFYMSPIDNYIKSVKGHKHYGRYEDDLIDILRYKQDAKDLLEEIKPQLADLKLTLNERKTHIVKLSHGFTFMKIKYNVDGNKIIKRPAREKASRERHRIKKHKKLYDKGLLTEYHIRNCYISWRNNVIKECNHCEKTINSLDRLYDSLFPEHETYKRVPRDKLIAEIFKEEYDENYLKYVIEMGEI